MPLKTAVFPLAFARPSLHEKKREISDKIGITGPRRWIRSRFILKFLSIFHGERVVFRGRPSLASCIRKPPGGRMPLKTAVFPLAFARPSLHEKKREISDKIGMTGPRRWTCFILKAPKMLPEKLAAMVQRWIQSRFASPASKKSSARLFRFLKILFSAGANQAGRPDFLLKRAGAYSPLMPLSKRLPAMGALQSLCFWTGLPRVLPRPHEGPFFRMFGFKEVFSI